MAIKVVGKSAAHVKRCVCRNCASELEYTLADTVQETHADYGGGRDMVRVLTCPSCGHRIIVNNY